MTQQLAALTFAALRAANSARQDEWCPDQKPDLSFRGNEMAGEVGEACNIIKKLERERQGWNGSRATVADLADELADVVICADLVAESQGIDLGAAVACKFDLTSVKRGLSVRLTGFDAEAPLTFVYRNWRGEEARRSVLPLYVWHGTTEWHTDPQWFLRAVDIDKGAQRDFAMKDIREMGGTGTDSADEHRCPICAKPFNVDDLCATDITEGICHAACLEGSPVVDLETGEQTGGKADTYRYGDEATQGSGG